MTGKKKQNDARWDGWLGRDPDTKEIQIQMASFGADEAKALESNLSEHDISRGGYRTAGHARSCYSSCSNSHQTLAVLRSEFLTVGTTESARKEQSSRVPAPAQGFRRVGVQQPQSVPQKRDQTGQRPQIIWEAALACTRDRLMGVVLHRASLACGEGAIPSSLDELFPLWLVVRKEAALGKQHAQPEGGLKRQSDSPRHKHGHSRKDFRRRE
eukprot:6190476-Pleurochrysis_carterae.AAC.6